jgi:predicted dinucleotide-binding enzyme
MHIAVLGTGVVGRTLAGRLHELGHTVVVGSRDPGATLARTEPDGQSFAAWQEAHPDVPLATFADAAAPAEVVLTACGGTVVLEVLGQVGEENLAGRVLVDVSNPLDFGAGFPPTLAVANTDSVAEQVQRAYPAARVVKTLNTVTAAVMVDPAQLGQSSTVFVSGDDPAAKALVTGLLESFGHDDVIDLGGIETARGAEMYVPLWLRLMGALGTAQFNVKVVR